MVIIDIVSGNGRSVAKDVTQLRKREQLFAVGSSGMSKLNRLYSVGRN